MQCVVEKSSYGSGKDPGRLGHLVARASWASCKLMSLAMSGAVALRHSVLILFTRSLSYVIVIYCVANLLSHRPSVKICGKGEYSQASAPTSGRIV